MANSASFDIKGSQALQRGLDGLDADLGDLRRPLREVGRDIARDASRRAPRQTGALAASIYVGQVTKSRATVNAAVRYAGYVEYGTRYMRARPYMSPAIGQASIEPVDDAVQQAVDDAARKADGRGP